jgi:ABC-2 type transport system permease protein
MMIRPLIAIVGKDLRVFLTDRHSVILSFAAPIALASFMAAIFGGAGPSASSRIGLVVIDEDGGPVSRAILTGAGADPRLAVKVADREGGTAMVRKGEAIAAVVIPRGFGEAASETLLGGGEPPKLTFVHDPTRRAELSMAEGVLTRVVLEAVAAESFGDFEDDPLAGGLDRRGPLTDEAVERAEFLALFGPSEGLKGSESDRADLLEAFPGLGDWFGSTPSRPATKAALKMPYGQREVSITAGGGEGERGALAAHAFAGMVVQFVLFSAVEWGVGLLIERQRGLWKRLRVAPVSRMTLLAGKVAGCLVSSLLISVVVILAGAIAFRFPIRGDVFALALTALSFAWMAANFGLMVASLGRSPQGARSIAVLAVLVMVMLGGGWIPSFLFPEWLQSFTTGIPTRWAIDGFDNVISKGYRLDEALPAIGVLAGFGVAFGGVAVIAFRWSEPA